MNLGSCDFHRRENQGVWFLRPLSYPRSQGPSPWKSPPGKPHVSVRLCHPWLLRRGDDAWWSAATGCRPIHL